MEFLDFLDFLDFHDFLDFRDFQAHSPWKITAFFWIFLNIGAADRSGADFLFATTSSELEKLKKVGFSRFVYMNM